MKLVTTLISLVTLIYLYSEFFEGSTEQEQIFKEKERIEVNLQEPLSPQLLEIEKEWIEKQNESLEKDNLDTNEVSVNRKSLKIGDSNYNLLGIFKEQGSDFILLKDDENQTLKLKQKDTLPGGYTLAEVRTNIVVFNFNGELKEYKLFEPKSHVKN